MAPRYPAIPRVRPANQSPREIAIEAFFECEGNNLDAINAAMDAYETALRERVAPFLAAIESLPAQAKGAS